MKRVLATALILVVATSCAIAKPKDGKSAKPKKDSPTISKQEKKETAPLPTPDKIVIYKTIGDVELDLHIFNPPNHKPGDKTPAIVLFYGGGWSGANMTQFYMQSEYLASRGIVAICPRYRTQSKYKTTPKECVKDAKSAIRWVRKHADELGIDPKMLAAGGGSAGGHIAAATGTIKGFNEAGEDTSVSCIPNALVLFNPVFDNSPEGYGHDRVKEYWKEFSPMENINKKTPPTLVLLGNRDKHLSAERAKLYKKRMDDLSLRCDLHIYEGQKHGFFNLHKGGEEYYRKTVIEADKFLTSLGYLKGEPTLQKK
jgi:acetyl esterase/lipase